MGYFSFSWGSQNILPNYIERDSTGSFFHSIIDMFQNGTKKGWKSEKAKLEQCLNNPALLKVLSFRADLYSQAKIDRYLDNKEVEKDFLYSQSKQPNDWQSWIDLRWDISFYRDLGTCYIYKEDDVIYCLNPIGIDFTDKQIKKFGELTFSKYGVESRNNMRNDTFNYINQNGTKIPLKLKNLYILSDLSNGVSGNWLKGNSRLDALYQVVLNSELSLTAKNRNLLFTTKFLVSGQTDESDIYKQPMDDTEQKSVVSGLLNKNIVVTPSKVDITQMVSNLQSLKLDDSYIADLTIIGNMYGMTKDVLDIVSKGSTYENKEKSLGAFIDYSLMPKLNQETDLWELVYNVEDLRGSFKHLPFNAVFEADRVNNLKIMLENLKLAQELGMDETDLKNKLTDLWERN